MIEQADRITVHGINAMVTLSIMEKPNTIGAIVLIVG
jgi:hypothetical protein